MCILPIHSNSHSSPQKVDRDILTTPFKRSSRASQESIIKFASHLTVFSQLVRQPHTCILPIHSNSHSSPQKVDRDIQTTPFERFSRASQESVIKFASHLTVFSQLVRQPYICVYYPYIQTAIAHLKKSIETYAQRRSKGLLEPQKNQSSNLRHTSQFSHN